MNIIEMKNEMKNILVDQMMNMDVDKMKRDWDEKLLNDYQIYKDGGVMLCVLVVHFILMSEYSCISRTERSTRSTRSTR